MPMKMAERYPLAPSKIFSGVFISRNIGRVKITLATVAISDTAVQRMVAVAIERRTPR